MNDIQIQLEIELLTVVIEGGGKRVEEAGHHIHSKPILSRTCEPGKILVKYWINVFTCEPGKYWLDIGSIFVHVNLENIG